MTRGTTPPRSRRRSGVPHQLHPPQGDALKRPRGLDLLIVLGQLDCLTGYQFQREAIQILAIPGLILNAGEIRPEALDVRSLIIAPPVLGFRKVKRLRPVAFLLPVITATLLVPNISPEVAIVGDIAAIPARLLIPALALAIIGLVMSVGATETIPGPDGTLSDVNRGFFGQIESV